MVSGVIAVYFEKDKLGIAYSVYNFISNFGIVTTTAGSTRLCMYIKIYIHIACLLVSFVCILAAEKLFLKKQKKNKEENSNHVVQRSSSVDSLLKETTI